MISIVATDHADIKFLKKRLRYLVYIEDYERAAVIRDWIKELYLYYYGKRL